MKTIELKTVKYFFSLHFFTSNKKSPQRWIKWLIMFQKLVDKVYISENNHLNASSSGGYPSDIDDSEIQ